MNYISCILSFFVAMAIQNEVKEIANLTTCFTKLEKLHRDFCGETSREDFTEVGACLGWQLDSRSLPSGCFFRIKKV